MAESNSSNHCSICFSGKANYVCPRCGITYCSVNCYKNPEKHLSCSESFYKKCVEEEMKAGMNASSKEEMVKGMNEILQRFQSDVQKDQVADFFGESDSEASESDSDSSLDSDDEESLEKRLQGIDLDNPDDVWKMLTPDEQAGFKRKLEKAKLDGVEVVADPWSPNSEDKLIEEVKPASSARKATK